MAVLKLRFPVLAILLVCARASAQLCDPCTPDWCPPCPPSCPDLGQPCSVQPPCTGTGVITACNPQGEGICACLQDCYCPPPPPTPTRYGDTCASINGQWDAPRGALVLVDSGNTIIGTLIKNALGEQFTHS